MKCGSWETLGRVSLWGHGDIPSSAALLSEAASACQEHWVCAGDYCHNALAGFFLFSILKNLFLIVYSPLPLTQAPK